MFDLDDVDVLCSVVNLNEVKMLRAASKEWGL